MICPHCKGKGHEDHDYPDGSFMYGPCVHCNGSGLVYCCEHYDDVLTHGVTMEQIVIKIEYKDYDVKPDQSGWYVLEYKSYADMADEVPCEVVGPFATQAAASRSVLEASDKDRRNERAPVSPATPTALDAGIPTDNEVDTD
jgi:hypothetical protein